MKCNQLNSDSSEFFSRTANNFDVIMVYADDILIVSENRTAQVPK